ncbi:hypothetical protein K490DRAFT_37021 [Saccharata proteae CBS 121410]|uniref:AAA+ ATPase domain-containing protein n=1 Tax=Saccharata proteae CBS 121410 TaxID=1314787 RepID=A0A6A5YDG6_9PEZI|nr:hypothetical protein K490DRAFT_37021 [Saccharata proteae CBS 121410]
MADRTDVDTAREGSSAENGGAVKGEKGEESKFGDKDDLKKAGGKKGDKGVGKRDKKGKGKGKEKEKEKGKGKGKGKQVESEDDEDSGDSSSDGDEDDESDASSSEDSSDEELARRKKLKKKRALKAERAKAKAKADKAKAKTKAKKNAKELSSSEDDSESQLSESESESDTASESETDQETQRARRRKAKKKQRKQEADDEADLSAEEAKPLDFETQVKLLKLRDPKKFEEIRKSAKKKSKRDSTLEFKRVDELWDRTIHNYKLKESAEDPEADEFDDCIFTVRRCFDYENKYKHTLVDIKSKLLREALKEIMKDVKGVSLVEDNPAISPNMLFLYLEELRTYAKKTLRSKIRKEKKRKEQKRLKLMAKHCKVMVDYLDDDYKQTRKTLEPMLKAGNITFDLVWAIFKPNTICYTKTYGSADHPRCFKVDTTYKDKSILRGEYYSVDGRYLEYDGKNFGLGDFDVDIWEFKGTKKISSLDTYPLSYHRDAEKLRKELIERGKLFTSMTGMNYRFHKGLAFEKKRRGVAKHNVNGRVMIDPAIFRRINANYQFSNVRAQEDHDLVSLSSDSDDSDDEEPRPHQEREEKDRYKVKYYWDEDSKEYQSVLVAVDELGNEYIEEKIEKLASTPDDAAAASTPNADDDDKPPSFTDEDFLIASPVVYGFAFSEKRWLEFSLSGIRPIAWNTGAFDSLVLAQDNKSIVKALVSSHKFHPASTIDDVVQGKGRGLVFLLHGPPGVGKTLTAEGIADFLKCPLYAVSAGELGTESWRLEEALQRIMDVAHSWGAILLLDEADVFLEKRQIHDIHRNALVSVFLRLLEYFQGILILTTNRVETFDDAFQSRMHLALRYDELTVAAKKAIWRFFLDRVTDMEAATSSPSAGDAPASASAPAPVFKDSDIESLARNQLNGRQIKNAVTTAQSLALDEGQALSMAHVRRVVKVGQSFERDLKGGSGYEDAMRSYT